MSLLDCNHAINTIYATIPGGGKDEQFSILWWWFGKQYQNGLTICESYKQCIYLQHQIAKSRSNTNILNQSLQIVQHNDAHG